MKIVRPIPVTSDILTSNVVETPPAAYSASTTYAEGAQVSVFGGVSNTEATVYESLVSGNLGNDPATSPGQWRRIGTAYLAWNSGTNYSVGATVTVSHRLYESIQTGTNHPVTDSAYWFDKGPSNRMAMFDESVATQTTRPLEIRAEIAVPGRADSVALFNLDAANVNVTVMDGPDEKFSEDFSLTSTEGIADWFAYYFEPAVRTTDLFVSGLPNVFNPTVIVTAVDGDDVSIGNCVIGLSREIGDTTYGAEVGIVDYSRITRDDFGNGTIVRRGFNKRGRFTVWIAKLNVDMVHRLLSQFRATPIVVVGSEAYASTFIYGLLKDWSISIDYPTYSQMNIELEGL